MLSGEVVNVGLLVTSESDASGTGVHSETALGGRALEVNLNLCWSDSRNYGYSQKGPI